MKIFKTGWSEGYDGPGRRWIIYMKGCNLRCRWCANPEGISRRDEILFSPERAQHAQFACTRGAVTSGNDGVSLNRDACRQCGERACVNVWHHPAFELAGSELAPGEIETQAQRYIPLFAAGGGVTFGGGEPTMQPVDLLDTLARLRHAGIHTAVETNAATPAFQRLIGKADLLICDFKCADDARHEEWTGSNRKLVRQNLLNAVRNQPVFWIRIPLVPGLNDDAAEMQAISDELAELNAARGDSQAPLKVEVLRMHHLGEPKYRALGLKYPMAGVKEPSVKTAGELVRLIKANGIECAMV